MTSGSLSRRSVLTGVVAGAGAAVGLFGVAGAGDRSSPVSMLVAGSLSNAVENGLDPATDAPLRVEARGSAEVARLVAEGSKDPDVVSVSDASLFASTLAPEWYAEFATNAVVLAYDPDSAAGRRVAAAGTDGWYRPLLDGDVSLGRTDPDLDPLGYRTLFVLDLATDYYGTDVDLRAAVPARDQVYPETQLVSQFETGAIDAAFTYRNMAVDRGYEYVELPSAIDLSDPDHADRYATATYELPAGTVVEGGTIRYASTVRHRSRAVYDAFEAHTSGRYLTEFGFGVPDQYPRFVGDVPGELAA